MRKNEARWIESRQRWQINVQSDGERRTFSDSTPGKKGKVACEKKADKWLEDSMVDENVRTEKMLDKWYEKLKISTSYSHYHQYDGYIRNWIKPVIGTKRIGSINKNDLQKVIDKAYAKRSLSKKTLSNIRGCIMAFMKYCRDGNATKLYPEKLSIPKSAKRSTKTIASADELRTLFSVTTTRYQRGTIEDRFVHAYRFAVLTGMRPGELIALLNTNIDGSKVKITQSINDHNELTQGKNENAQRTYTLSYHAVKTLEDQRKMLAGLGQISKYVFPDSDRDYIDQQGFRRAWQRYCAANDIKGATTPYELRHTFVSINTDMPSALKKMVIGHSIDMDTDGTYGHEKQGDMEKAAEYISDAFKNVLGW